jgi:hypothetical protein
MSAASPLQDGMQLWMPKNWLGIPVLGVRKTAEVDNGKGLEHSHSSAEPQLDRTIPFYMSLLGGSLSRHSAASNLIASWNGVAKSVNTYKAYP